MADVWDVNRLTREWTARGLDRRELMRLVGAGAGMAALTTLLGTSPERAAAQAAESQINVLWDTSPATLNPLYSSSGTEQQVERAIFGSLVKMSGDLVPTPDLCESIDATPDGSVYTFKLKQGLTFTDGTPLTSDDVIFTLERAINPSTGSIWKGRLSGVKGAAGYDGTSGQVEGLKAVDDLTIEVTLASPDGAFLPNLCSFSGLGILPKHILGDVAPDALKADPFSLAPSVSAGGFTFVQYATDQYLEMKKNESYPGGVSLDHLFMRILTPEVGLGQLETGEIDIMTVPVADMEHAKGLANITVVSVPSPSMDFLALNLDRPYLQNPQMRQAMMYAIDRENIVKSVLQGEGTVVNSSIFGPDWMGTPEGLELYAFDPDKAKSLLDQSGFDKSQKLQLMIVPGTPSMDAAAAIMQQQLNDVGFDIELLQVDVPELIRRYVDETDFDLFYNAGGVFRADPSISATYFATPNFTPSGGNGSHYTNAQVDDLFNQGKAETDQTKRKAIYTQIAQILNTDVPWIFLWSPNSIFGFNNRVQGFSPPSYSNNKLWNAETWTVSQ